MSADALLSRLEKVKRTGHGMWRAKCPAHSGDNPAALSILEIGARVKYRRGDLQSWLDSRVRLNGATL